MIFPRFFVFPVCHKRMHVHIHIQVGLSESPIELQGGYDFVKSSTAGAITSFVGTTRDNFEGKKVTELEYEAYPDMALEEMKKIALDIREKW